VVGNYNILLKHPSIIPPMKEINIMIHNEATFLRIERKIPPELSHSLMVIKNSGAKWRIKGKDIAKESEIIIIPKSDSMCPLFHPRGLFRVFIYFCSIGWLF
jgi:hypothetical protein